MIKSTVVNLGENLCKLVVSKDELNKTYFLSIKDSSDKLDFIKMNKKKLLLSERQCQNIKIQDISGE